MTPAMHTALLFGGTLVVYSLVVAAFFKVRDRIRAPRLARQDARLHAFNDRHGRADRHSIEAREAMNAAMKR